MRFLFLALGLFGATTGFADEKPSFDISARYEGFSPTYLAEAALGSSGQIRDLGTPHVTTLAGQRATVEIIKEYTVPSSVDASQKVNCGVTLQVEPALKDGKIILSGKSIVRRRETPAGPQPLNALSFTTRETFFDGEVADGKPLTIQVGEAPTDQAKIVLTVSRVAPKAVTSQEKHTRPPNYRVYAVNPSPTEAQKPIFQLLKLDAADASLNAMCGIFSPEALGPAHAETWRLVETASQEIPAAEMPIKIDSTLGADGQTLDLKIQSAREGVRMNETDVSVDWGSAILLTVNDASQPTGRRGLLIRQE